MFEKVALKVKFYISLIELIAANFILDQKNSLLYEREINDYK